MLPSTARRLAGRPLRRRFAGAAVVTLLAGVPATVMFAGHASAACVDTDRDGRCNNSSSEKDIDGDGLR
ncbi:MAG: hypothetical protein KGR47_02395, partial [Acidobacteria bacterium]|nr:hypothetical protein [Acidobacteriota bacterium]